MNKFLIILAVCLMVCNQANAQSHVFRTNLSSLLYRNISVHYEYVLNKRLSVGLGTGYMPRRSLSGLVVSDETNFSVPMARGLFITPELRYYPLNKKDAPFGWYLSLYGRHTNYSIRMDFPFTDLNDQIHYLDADFNYGGTGVGAGTGIQWKLGKRFIVDFYAVGGHIGKGGVKGTLKGNSGSELTDKDLDLLESELRREYPTLELEAKGNQMMVSVPGLRFLGFRGLGLHVGLIF